MAAPPPPPAPAPPPMGNFKLSTGKSSGDSRSALLQSIQKGTKLKPTVTVDKSGPALSGKVSNSNSNNNISSNSNAPFRPSPPTNSAQSDTPKLGGIFEGLSSMPKLKPVGARNNSKSPPSESPSTTSSIGGSPKKQMPSSAAVGDFSAELTKHLTLKKQKQQNQESNSSPNDLNSRNRGPPPQPPNKISSTTVTDNLVKSNGSSPTIPPNGTTTPLPNKSSLFGKVGATNSTVNSKGSNNLNSDATISAKTIKTTNTITVTLTNKPVPNHGKPNCAPKPPSLSIAKNSMDTNNENSTRSVSRAHSMRTPRSPPLSTAATVPTFQSNSANQFGTIRGAPTFKSQEAIHVASLRPAPGVPINRPKVAPPRPPVEAKKNPSPPPPPKRSVSNSNLPGLSLSVPGISQNNTSTNFGSAGNVSTLFNATSDVSAPPLPPHRQVAPPPPTRQTSMTPGSRSNNNDAPPVPRRDSSMRSGQTGHITSANTTTPKSSRTINLTIVDLDARYGHAFHSVAEFPSPSPFQNLKYAGSAGL